MESLSNQNMHENSESLHSNVELRMPGIDKTWVRSNGSWTDKTKVPTVEAHSFPTAIEIEATSSHWWQFWKA
ncbi:MAG: hypothetical protein COA38_17510 [Fluviicola sp.]|nr:MAG: hypothetical protein COA38_17510 [Fluviicola sp.]